MFGVFQVIRVGDVKCVLFFSSVHFRGDITLIPKRVSRTCCVHSLGGNTFDENWLKVHLLETKWISDTLTDC